MFGVNLIKVRPLRNMSGVEVFDLMVNARHVAGQYWIFEGDPDALVSPCRVVGKGVTEGIGDLDDTALRTHCEEIFDVDLEDEPAPWEMYR